MLRQHWMLLGQLSWLVLATGVFAQPGTLDLSFDISAGANDSVNTILLQTSDRILIGGDFTEYNGIPREGMARLSANGNLDSTFSPKFEDGSVYALAIQPADGKIVVGGNFATLNGLERSCLARLNMDGTVDTTLTIHVDDTINSIGVNLNGNFIGGDFTYLSNGNNEESRNYVARIVANSIKPWNSPGVFGEDGPDSAVYAVAIDADGKVLIGGEFSSIISGDTSVQRNGIARLKEVGGDLDSKFNPGSGANKSVFSIVIQPNGMILVGGEFTLFNGARHEGLARLKADGSLDSTFNPQCGTEVEVRALALQPDGKILMGGNFAAVNGHPSCGLARLHADGSVDRNFSCGDMFEGSTVYTVVPLANGQILVGGDFTVFLPIDDLERGGLVRINGDQAPRITVHPTPQTQVEGGSVQFNVTAMGAGNLSYQWYKEGALLQESPRIHGTTTASLSLAQVEFEDDALYTVAVGNGIGTVISREAELTITPVSEVRINSPTLAVQAGSFQFQLAGANTGRVVIEASEDLIKWGPILTNGLPGEIISIPIKGPRQFYRAVIQP